jgi:hypothetical protein
MYDLFPEAPLASGNDERKPFLRLCLESKKSSGRIKNILLHKNVPLFSKRKRSMKMENGRFLILRACRWCVSDM